MPECKSALSLQQTCLRTVANNMDFWCKNFVENFKTMKNLKYFIGPFDELSSDIANMLLEQLKYLRNLQRPHLFLLINHSLNKLDLSGCHLIVKDDIINVVIDRCKALKSVNLRNCKQIKKETLVKLSETFPNLQSLNLEGTKCEQEAAKAVFQNCTQLKELILSRCQLKDEDLMVLINNVQENGTHQNLRIFSLNLTNIGWETLKLVLQYLPWITLLEHEHLRKSLCCLSKDRKKAGGDAGPPLQLRSLQLDENWFSFDSKSFKDQLRLCPLLVKIEFIQAFSFTNDFFDEMANLQMLRDFKLVGEVQNMVEFEDVQRLFEKIGRNLQIIVLENIDRIDILKIAELCPNLVQLVLTNHEDQFQFFSDEITMYDIHLPKLKKLKLGGNESSNEGGGVLTKLLSACHVVENLTLTMLKDLSDDVLNKTLTVNKMTRLTKLEIFACKTVTNESLQELIFLPTNRLNYVHIMNCWNVTYQDYAEWLKLAKEKNYNIQFDWC